MATFINREKEIKYLNSWLESEPNALLFIYGPKSCGKTTLMNKVLEAMDEKNYAINYLNLRRMHFSNYKTFCIVFSQNLHKKEPKKFLET